MLDALAAWSRRYGSGEWDDPPGKLALLHDIEHVSKLLLQPTAPTHFTPTATARRSYDI